MYGKTAFPRGSQNQVSVSGQHVTQVPGQVQRVLLSDQIEYGIQMQMHGQMKSSISAGQEQIPRHGHSDVYRQIAFGGRMQAPGNMLDQGQCFTSTGYRYMLGQQGHSDQGLAPSSGHVPGAMKYGEVHSQVCGQTLVQGQILSPRQSEVHGKMMPMQIGAMTGMSLRTMQSPTAVEIDKTKMLDPGSHQLHMPIRQSVQRDNTDIYYCSSYAPVYAENSDVFPGYEFQQQSNFVGLRPQVKLIRAPSMAPMSVGPHASSDIQFAYCRPAMQKQNLAGIHLVNASLGWSDLSSNSGHHVNQGQSFKAQPQWQHHSNMQLNQAIPDYHMKSGSSADHHPQLMTPSRQLSPSSLQCEQPPVTMPYNVVLNHAEGSYSALGVATPIHNFVPSKVETSPSSYGFSVSQADDSSSSVQSCSRRSSRGLISAADAHAISNSSFSPVSSSSSSGQYDFTTARQSGSASYGLWTMASNSAPSKPIVHTSQLPSSHAQQTLRPVGPHGYHMQMPHQQYLTAAPSTYGRGVHQYPYSRFHQPPINQPDWQVKEKESGNFVPQQQVMRMPVYQIPTVSDSIEYANHTPRYMAPGMVSLRGSAGVMSDSAYGAMEIRNLRGTTPGSYNHGWPPASTLSPAKDTGPMAVRYVDETAVKSDHCDGAQAGAAGDYYRAHQSYMQLQQQAVVERLQFSPIITQAFSTDVSTTVSNTKSTVTLSFPLPVTCSVTVPSSAVVSSPACTNMVSCTTVTRVMSVPGTEVPIVSNLCAVSQSMDNTSLLEGNTSMKKSSTRAKRKKSGPKSQTDLLLNIGTQLSDTTPLAQLQVASEGSDVPTDFNCENEMKIPISMSISVQQVVVPYGWKRSVLSGSVVYHSPSEVQLNCLDEVRRYLLSEGTCKCGLHCPLDIEKTFIFDATQIESKHLHADDVRLDLDRDSNLCNHRRKIIAMATFQQSTGVTFSRQDMTPVSKASNMGLSIIAQGVSESCVSGSTGTDVMNGDSNQELVSAQRTSHSSATSVSSGVEVISSSVTSPKILEMPSLEVMAESYARDVAHFKQHCGSASHGSERWPVYRHPVRYPDPVAIPSFSHFEGSDVGSLPLTAGQFTSSVRPNSIQFVRPFYPSTMAGPVSMSSSMVGPISMSYNYHIPATRSDNQPSVYTNNPSAVVSESWNTPLSRALTNPTKAKKKCRASGQKETYGRIIKQNMPCPNIDVRQIIQEQRERIQIESSLMSVSSQSAFPSSVISAVKDSKALQHARQAAFMNYSQMTHVPCSLPYVPISSVSVTCGMPYVHSTSVSVPCSSPCIPSSCVSVTCGMPYVHPTPVSVPCSSPLVPISSVSVACSSPFVPISSFYIPCGMPYVPSTSVSVPCSSPYVPSGFASIPWNMSYDPSGTVETADQVDSKIVQEVELDCGVPVTGTATDNDTAPILHTETAVDDVSHSSLSIDTSGFEDVSSWDIKLHSSNTNATDVFRLVSPNTKLCSSFDATDVFRRESQNVKMQSSLIVTISNVSEVSCDAKVNSSPVDTTDVVSEVSQNVQSQSLPIATSACEVSLQSSTIVTAASVLSLPNMEAHSSVLEETRLPTCKVQVCFAQPLSTRDNTVVTYSLTSGVVSSKSTTSIVSNQHCSVSYSPVETIVNTFDSVSSPLTSSYYQDDNQCLVNQPLQMLAQHRCSDDEGSSLSVHSATNWPSDIISESPIKMVQNMVSDLATTQNSLAMAASIIMGSSESGPRPRRSGPTEYSSVQSSSNALNQFESSAMDTSGKLGNDSCEIRQTEIVCTSPCTLQIKGSIQFCSAICVANNVSERTSNSSLTVQAQTKVTNVLTRVVPATGIVPCNSAENGTPISPCAAPIGISLCANIVSSSSDSSSCVFSSTGVSTALITASNKVDTLCNTVSQYSLEPHCRLPVVAVLDEDDTTQDCDAPESIVQAQHDALCTIRTHTSTPMSGLSNLMDSDSGDVCDSLIDDIAVRPPSTTDCSSIVSSSTVDEAAVVSQPSGPLAVTSCIQSEATRFQSSGDNVIQGPAAHVVMVPSVAPTPFVLPPNITFATGPVVGHSFLHLQHSGEFGNFGVQTSAGCVGGIGQPGTAALGLVHFAPGTMVGPAVGSIMTSSSRESISGQPNPVHFVGPVKSDAGVFIGGEYIQLVAPAALPPGHIFVQNIMPGLASFNGTGTATIMPFVQPTALCNPSTLFAVGHGSLGLSLGGTLAFTPALTDQRSTVHEPAPDPPDSTVDGGEDPSSDDSADMDRVSSSRPILLSRELSTPVLSSIVSLDTNIYVNSFATENPLTAYSGDGKIDGGIENEDATGVSVLSRPVAVTPTAGTGGFVGPMRSKYAKSSRQRFVRKHRASGLKLISKSSSKVSASKSSMSSMEAGDVSGTSKGNFIFQHDVEPFKSADVSSCQDSYETVQLRSNSDCRVSTTLSSDELVDEHMPRLRGRQLRSSQRHPWNKRTISNADCISQHSESCSSGSQLHENDDGADSTTGASVPSSPRVFNIGDLVWGPSRGFPSWPGKLVSSEDVRGNLKLETGKIWVKWFGVHTYTQEEPSQLKTLSEGLDTHHNAIKKCRQGRKMNASLEAAIQEAMSELDAQPDESTMRRSISPVASGSGPHDRGLKSRFKKKTKK